MHDQIRIVEVGPRDGLQNERSMIDVATKHEYIRRLVSSGLDEIEATAFVRPDAIPQLADAEALMTLLDGNTWPDVSFPVLVPNMHGYARAREAGIQSVSLFTAASESFNRKNINASIAESIERFREVVDAAAVDGVHVRAYVSMAFGCPYEGQITPAQVAEVTSQLVDLGITDISLGDTIGIAVPASVERAVEAVAQTVDIESLGLHLHDTRGTALACVKTGLDMGIRAFDSATGGVGGCPYAEGATGNLATEDLVWFLAQQGFSSNISLPTLIETARWICMELDRPLSHIAAAPLIDYSQAG